jgi:hypothetical protein
VAPAEGRFRSQYWSFSGSVRWLRVYARYEERGNGGVRLSEEVMVKMKMVIMKPTWPVVAMVSTHVFPFYLLSTGVRGTRS